MDPQDTLIGQTVGNYHITDVVGAGAMGQVFLGEHPQIGRKVAVKVLNFQLSSNSDMSTRFLSEARAVNRIDHPNIVQVFDFGTLPDGRLYLVMEFLKGRDLGSYMDEKRRLSLRETLEILEQLASGLDAAHEAGIVHRDLKPDNIFLVEGKNGLQVKIVDFGVAKLLEPDLHSGERTATGLIMGTPAYMSPEQATGDVNNIGPASDLYALGIIVYRMLSARLPIEGDFVPQILLKHISEPPTPISKFLPDFPLAVWEVLARTLAKAPADRPKTAREFFEVFSFAVDRMATSRTMTPFESTEGITLDPLPPHARPRAVVAHRRGFVAAAAVAGVLVAGVLLWALFFHDGGASDGPEKSAADPGPMAPADAPAPMDPPPGPPADRPQPAQVHKLVINADAPEIPVQVSIDRKKPVAGTTPFEVFAPTGASVRITSEHPRYRGVIREVIVTVDLEINLEAVNPEPPATDMPADPGTPPADMPATGSVPLSMRPAVPAMTPDTPMIGEDDTIKPMF